MGKPGRPRIHRSDGEKAKAYRLRRKARQQATQPVEESPQEGAAIIPLAVPVGTPHPTPIPPKRRGPVPLSLEILRKRGSWRANKREREERRAQEETLCEPAELFALASGFGWLLPLGKDPAQLAGVWELMADRLVAAHAARYPGSRPWGWWRWSAPEPLRCLSGAHHCDRATRPGLQELYYGQPRYFCCPLCFEEGYESPARFLRRLGLLLPEEAQIVPKSLEACNRWYERTYTDILHPGLTPKECQRLARA
jgi:hypothetical protein